MGQQRLKRDVVLSLFDWTQAPSTAQLARQERAKKRKIQHQDELHPPKCINDEITESVPAMEVEVDVENAQPTPQVNQQPVLPSHPTTASTPTQTGGGLRLSVKHFINDPEGMMTFTGLENYDKFKYVLQTLGPAAYCLNYYYSQVVAIDVEDQFFLTLYKCRCADSNMKMSRILGVSEFTITNVFVTWINFMYFQWGELETWPSRETL